MIKCINCRKHHQKKNAHTCDVSMHKTVYGLLQEQFIKPCHYYEPIMAETGDKHKPIDDRRPLPKKRGCYGKCDYWLEAWNGGRCTAFNTALNAIPYEPDQCVKRKEVKRNGN